MIQILGFEIQPPPSLAFLATPLGEFLLTALVWLVIALVAYLMLTYLLRWLTRSLPGEADDIILGILRRPLLILLVVLGVTSSIRALQLPEDLTVWTQRVLLTAEILIGAWVVWRILRDVILYYGQEWALRTETRVDDILLPLVNLLGGAVILLGTLLLILPVFGIDVSSILVGAGVVGLVLGLALQDTLGNVFSGISLIADTPFRTGDLITLPGKKIYRVDRIGLRTTLLYSYEDHTTIYIPNHALTDEPIENISKPTVDLRVSVEVGVAYASDLPRVERILLDVAWAHPNILGSEAKLKRKMVRAELDRLTAAGAGAAADRLERALAKMEREHVLFDRVGEFDSILRDLAEAIHAREDHGLTEAEIRELDREHLAPANIVIQQMHHALNEWRALADPWAYPEEVERENLQWEIRHGRLERRWVSLRSAILDPRVEHAGRLDMLTQGLRDWLCEDYKFPPAGWKDPKIDFVGFGTSSVDIRLVVFIDDGRLEHFQRRTRVPRELAFTIHRRFKEEGIEIPFPQNDVWFRNPLPQSD